MESNTISPTGDFTPVIRKTYYCCDCLIKVYPTVLTWIHDSIDRNTLWPVYVLGEHKFLTEMCITKRSMGKAMDVYHVVDPG